MRAYVFVPLILSIAAAGLFGQEKPASASQKMNVVRPGGVERTMSQNEALLAQFQSERDELLRNRKKEKNQRLLKNKLKILNNKIQYLEKKISAVPAALLKKPSSAQAAEKAPAVQKAPSPAGLTKSEALKKLKPLPVKWKAYAPAEERRRHYLAWDPSPADLRDPSGAAQRLDASQRELPLEVRARSAASHDLRTAPQRKELAAAPAAVPAPVQPHAVEPRAALKHEAREEALQAPEPPAAPPAGTKTKSGKTGAQWKEMQREDKEIYILSLMGNLSRRDVYLMKPYNYYIETIDDAISKNVELEQEFVHRILMVSAYENEPDTRKDLEKVWK
jgi:hypothetical protein